MRNAMKKFVAAVLTLSMLLGMSVTVFAATPPPPNLTGMDPTADVSLRIHHTRGHDLNGDPLNNTMMISPGHTVNPTVPLGRPVVGATWHAVRITVPAGNITPAQMAALENRIVNNAGDAWGAGLLTGFAATSEVLTQLTSGPGTDSSLLPTPPVPPLAGIAEFSSTAIAGAVASHGGGTGQGVWFVWETLRTTGTLTDCPHNGTNPVYRPRVNLGTVADPIWEWVPSQIHDPFLVNLPTWVHRTSPDNPNMNHATPLPGAPAPGYWVYHVNVWPKPPAPPPLNKTPGSAVPGIVDGNFITTLPWTIYAGVPSETRRAQDPGPGYEVNPLFHPINNPLLPSSLVGAGGATAPGNLPGDGTTPASFVVIRDILDYRIRLQGFDELAPQSAASLAAMRAAMIVDVYDPTTNTVLIPATGAGSIYASWQLVSHHFGPSAALPGGGTVPATHNPIPNPDGSLGPAVAHPGVQVFWIHFTNLDPLYQVAGNADARIRVRFNTVTELDVAQLGVIDNDFSFYASRNPGANFGDVGTLPGSDLYGINVSKRTPTTQALDGAVFYLFRADQMQAPDANGNRIPIGWGTAPFAMPVVIPAAIVTNPNSGTADPAAPIRHTVSGAHIAAPGTPLTVTPPGGFTYTTLPSQLVAGQALFLGLPPIVEMSVGGTVGLHPNSTHADALNRIGAYYIFERFAPAGYTSIQGFRRIEIIDEGGSANVLPNATPPVTSVPFIVTNTREFELPLTGGAGTIMFTAAGVSLMGGAGLFLFLARKKEKVQK